MSEHAREKAEKILKKHGYPTGDYCGLTDSITETLLQYERELEELRQSHTCRFAGPGRGDCEHFVGVPEILDEHTTDLYGKPNGWCWNCWWGYRTHKAEELVASYDRQDELIGGEFEGVDEVTDVIRLLKDERDQLKSQLTNLLCRIHRDGGHYIQQHGVEKALADADEIVVGLMAENDRLKSELEEATIAAAKHIRTERQLMNQLTACVRVMEQLEPHIGHLEGCKAHVLDEDEDCDCGASSAWKQAAATLADVKKGSK